MLLDSTYNTKWMSIYYERVILFLLSSLKVNSIGSFDIFESVIDIGSKVSRGKDLENLFGTWDFSIEFSLDVVKAVVDIDEIGILISEELRAFL